MKLYYYIDKRGNFGDDLNPWLWPKLMPNFLNEDNSELFVGIGTLLNNNVPKSPRKIVFGSGIGYGSALPTLDEKWKFYCVRGPLTAARLGLPSEYAITDPAAIVSTIFNVDDSKQAGIAFIPHHVSAWNLDWEHVCQEVGIRYIDPRKDVDTVLEEISKSSAIITEAMHGAILADCFRIPWMPVVLYDHILKPKWQDWTQSLGLKYTPIQLEGAWDSDYNFSKMGVLKNTTKRLLYGSGLGSTNWTPPPRKSTKREIETFIHTFDRMVRHVSLTLSKDTNFDRALSRLAEKLDELRRDYMFVQRS
jgi:succinoglycan biosynthesis protein ExoV